MCLGPDQLRAWNKPTQCARWVCLFIDSAMSNLTASVVGIELPILSKGSSSANHFTNRAPLLPEEVVRVGEYLGRVRDFQVDVLGDIQKVVITLYSYINDVI